MNPKIKELWLNALKSGHYQQGVGRLHNHKGKMCCLGVLCDLYIKAHPTQAAWVKAHTISDCYTFRSSDGEVRCELSLPKVVNDWAGLGSFDGQLPPECHEWGRSLAVCNDWNCTGDYSVVIPMIEKYF